MADTTNKRLEWDPVGEHWFSQGVSRGVLYPQANNGVYGEGVAWNGFRSFEENPSGAESTKYYADNDVYLNILSKEIFAGTLGAYTYPKEFETCNGSKELAKGVTIGQQARQSFGFCYRTEKGNDTNQAAGYVIHLIYGCKASPSSKSHQSVGDSPQPEELSWSISTTPVDVPSQNTKTATLDIDSTTVSATQLAALEDILYGKGAVAPKLPLPEEVAKIFATVQG